MDPLDLYGPKQRIQIAVEATRAGRCLLSSDEGRGALMRDRLEHSLHLLGFRILPVGADHTPEHCAELLGVASIADPGRLLQNPDLNRQVLQIDCSRPSWRDWGFSVLQRLAGGAPAECLRFWFIWPEDVRKPPAKVIHTVEWTGCIAPADVRMFAADRFRERSGPGPTHYWESLAAEVAGPDLDLIEEMARQSAPMLDPVAWLRKCGAPGHPTVAYDTFSRFESPLNLAARVSSDRAAADELNRRIWSAQAKALFSGMEAERPSLLASFKRQLDTAYLTMPDPEVRVIPRDVEWGPAFARLKGDRNVPDTTKTFLMHARDVRNHIAHGEPAGADLLGRFLTAASVTLKGKWL